MIYRKTIKIAYVVITKDDLQRLASVLEAEYEKDPHELKYSVSFKDKMSITDNSTGFLESDYLLTKCANCIIMEYIGSHYNRHIDIAFSRSDFAWEPNEVRITSDGDEDWFLRTCKVIEEKLNSLQKQKLISRLYPSISTCLLTLLLLCFAFGYGTYLILSLSRVLSVEIIKSLTAVGGFLGVIFGFLLVKAYPNIEFRFGRDNKPNIYKKWVWNILIIYILNFLLPMALSYLIS